MSEINSYMDGKDMAPRLSEWKSKGWILNIANKYSLPFKEMEETSDKSWSV